MKNTKKAAAIMGLMAMAAFPACTSQRGYGGEQYRAHEMSNQQYDRAGGEGEGNWKKGDWQEHKERMLQAKVDQFFAEADKGHKGYITWKDMEAYAHRKFREADADRNGRLSRDEVVEMARREMDKMHERMRGGHDEMGSMQEDKGMRPDDMNRSDNRSDNRGDESSGNSDNQR